jgi:RHS repeat-associated protein
MANTSFHTTFPTSHFLLSQAKNGSESGMRSAVSYRFGFNGQEMDNEIKGDGNSVTFRYRIHDPRLGRFFSVDPLAKKFPWWTPYQFAGNTPIEARELEGLETYHTSVENGDPNPEPIRDPITGWELHGPITPAALEETEEEWNVEINYMGYETDVFQDVGLGDDLAEYSSNLPYAPDSYTTPSNKDVNAGYTASNTYSNPHTPCYLAVLSRADKIIGEKLGIYPFTDGKRHVVTEADAYNMAINYYTNYAKQFIATGVGGALVSMNLGQFVSDEQIRAGGLKPGAIIQGWYTSFENIQNQLESHYMFPSGGHSFVFLKYVQINGKTMMKVSDYDGVRVFSLDLYTTLIGVNIGVVKKQIVYEPIK